jgi:ubiquinone/menaquinone biosynthesis C-methylase UbiE
MKIAGLYDALSSQYNKSCSYGIINDAQLAALRQLQKHFPANATLQVLDVGVGAGDFFQKLRPNYPNVSLAGLDLSEKMLLSAQKKVDFVGVKGSVQELEKFFPNGSKDVAAAHFISAYVPIDEIFKKCNDVLKVEGVMSLLTTTYESFAHLQNEVAGMKNSLNPISKFIYVMVNKGLKKTRCPRDMKEIESKAAEAGLTIVESQRLATKVSFNDEVEAMHFVFNDGWGVNIADVPFIPFRLARFLTMIFLKKFKYPFEDEIVIDALLLRKIKG